MFQLSPIKETLELHGRGKEKRTRARARTQCVHAQRGSQKE